MPKYMSKILSAFAVSSFIVLSTAQVFAYEPVGDKIKTRWSAEVSPANARTEYPRPQMVRKEWKNLNGLWDYAIASKDDVQMPQAQGRILVPYCIESSLSGVGKKVSSQECLWYKTTFGVPAKWDGSTILLHFDAVDWSATVYVDDNFVGEHTGGFTAFDFDVTKYVTAGKESTVTVKVWDPCDDAESSVPRGKQVRNSRGIWYTPVTGIWQTVWLESVPEKGYIADYNVFTDIDNGIVAVDANCVGTRDGDKIRVDVLRPKIGYDTQKPGWSIFRKGRAKVNVGQLAQVKIRRPRLWTPDTPYLYGLTISLIRDGRVIDKVQAYTAMRSISAKVDEYGVKRLALNGKILFQLGPLDQGWWPDGLYTAPTREAMLFDIVKTKELGFNMIRKHVKVEPAGWYYGCDREGIMVWQDMPNMGRSNGRGQWAQGEDVYGAGSDYWALNDSNRANYYKEWTEIISQLKKFQSIVVWVPFNEAWGQFDTGMVADFTKAIDPTRLVNAASGGNWIKGAGDILDSHSYPNPKMRILDDEMVNVVGEYGGIGYPVEGHVWDADKNWGYVKYDSSEKATDTYIMYARDLIDVKQVDKCAAGVYTQTTDVEGEVNGFYTYDREILKLDPDRVRKANQDVINAPCHPDIALIAPSRFHYKDNPDSKQYNLYTIRGGNLTMQVTDFGARIISLFAPDSDGVCDDIIVGYGDMERFAHNSGERFLGATVGRVANRIGAGRFTLDGKTYTLPKNNNGQTLHGGLLGVDMVRWKLEERTDSSIVFGYVAPDSQDGFPGNLDIKLTYTLTCDNTLDIAYSAVTDAATPVNFSNHAFFNLLGSKGGTITDHRLTIYADGITPVDENLIPTGEIMPVEGTPFDFRQPHLIGERLGDNHQQLVYGHGYDHNWVLNAPADGNLHHACHLSEDTTGRILDIFTDQPGLQFYCGNFFDGSYCGKTSDTIGFREALVFETQKFPDAVNHPQFPDTILRPGQTYTHHSVYKFSAK